MILVENFKLLENNLLNFLDSYLKSSGAKGFVLGLSGGLDSAVVATLCTKVAPTK
ncbi:MAG: NAD(+) synthetase, partial [Campylobacter sp.]|nr:NAD(+) synthetase [Campylobacter sp.]